jgi:bifunctional DNA-binding transcriptional regulator/antitoxin component of YhaV-PrlF toxin-antitoxin module
VYIITLKRESEMNMQRGKLVSGGRLQVPADFRRLMGVEDGDAVTMEVANGVLHVRPLRDAVAAVQARLKAYAPKAGLLSDELIAERRAAAGHE